MSKSTKFKKVFVILALVGFLLFTALSAVMYLAEPKPEIPVNLAIEECENAGWIWSEENQECEEQSVVIDSEQECQEQWTRYAENGCI